MLVAEREEGLQLVTQPDHAAVAEQLGERWGNESFAVPARRAALLTAARRHDDGWSALDDLPVVVEAAGRPAHFLEVGLPDTVGPYGDGVDRVYEEDAYAGVLTSMHWAGLYSARWGVQAGPPVDHPRALEVVAEQRERVIPNVPTALCEHADVSVRIVEPGMAAVTPYPFAVARFEVGISTRRMPHRTEGGAEAVASVYRAVAPETTTVTVVADDR